jgi:uncharacterized SAM-binding protein YcdF (DUF218 family)
VLLTKHGKKRSREAKKARVRLAVFILILLGLCFGLAWVAAQALIVKLPLERVDALVVLSGSSAYLERTHVAAQLYASGRAPTIILTNDDQQSGWSETQQRNPFFSELARDKLTASGVRSAQIEIVPVAVTGTYDECLKIRRYAEMRGHKSLLVVTSAYHSRRALWTLRRVFRGSGIEIGLDIVKPGQQMPSPTTWWLSRRGWQVVALEYPKLVYYWLRYR